MNTAISLVMSQNQLPLPPDEQVHFEGIRTSGEWAVTEPVIRNRKSGTLIGGEGLPMLLRKLDGRWRAAFPGTAEFASWLSEVPDDLISPETKQLLK
jgi:hypothetical protein